LQNIERITGSSAVEGKLMGEVQIGWQNYFQDVSKFKFTHINLLHLNLKQSVGAVWQRKQL